MSPKKSIVGSAISWNSWIHQQQLLDRFSPFSVAVVGECLICVCYVPPNTKELILTLDSRYESHDFLKKFTSLYIIDKNTNLVWFYKDRMHIDFSAVAMAGLNITLKKNN